MSTSVTGNAARDTNHKAGSRTAPELTINTRDPSSYNKDKPIYSHKADEDDEEDDDDESDLPFPAELPRSDFLQENFDAPTYLSSLRNRHQTLEDLRSDLRARSQLLSRELLELVNGQYEEFLSLGDDLRGGEERVENVRVGLLGFEREVKGIWTAVKEREDLVAELMREREGIMKDTLFGRMLLDFENKIVELEGRLGLKGKEEVGEDGVDEDDDTDDEDEEELDDGVADAAMGVVRRLRRHTCDFILITRTISRIGATHPFVQKLQPRVDELRKTILLDLATALRKAKSDKASDAILTIVKLYGDLGAEREGLRVIKGT